MMRDGTGQFSILIVCTANLCRSPLTEHAFKEQLGQQPEKSTNWRVSSAGTQAATGHKMHPLALEALAQRQANDGSAFRSRRLTLDLIQDADLILTATREHRATVVQLSPTAGRRTFTLKQAARLVEAATTAKPKDVYLQSGTQLVDRIIAGRSLVQPVSERQENLKDPIGRRIAAFRKCLDEVEQLTSKILTGFLQPTNGTDLTRIP